MSPAPDTVTMNSEAIGGDDHVGTTLKSIMKRAEDTMDSRWQDPVPDDMKGNNPCTQVAVSTIHPLPESLHADGELD